SYAIVDHSLSPAATRASVARFVSTAPAGMPAPAFQEQPPAGVTVVRKEPAAGGIPFDPGSGTQAHVISSGVVQGLLGDVRTATLRSLLWTWAAVVSGMAVAA